MEPSVIRNLPLGFFNSSRGIRKHAIRHRCQAIGSKYSVAYARQLPRPRTQDVSIGEKMAGKIDWLASHGLRASLEQQLRQQTALAARLFSDESESVRRTACERLSDACSGARQVFYDQTGHRRRVGLDKDDMSFKDFATLIFHHLQRTYDDAKDFMETAKIPPQVLLRLLKSPPHRDNDGRLSRDAEAYYARAERNALLPIILPHILARLLSDNESGVTRGLAGSASADEIDGTEVELPRARAGLPQHTSPKSQELSASNRSDARHRSHLSGHRASVEIGSTQLSPIAYGYSGAARDNASSQAKGGSAQLSSKPLASLEEAEDYARMTPARGSTHKRMRLDDLVINDGPRRSSSTFVRKPGSSVSPPLNGGVGEDRLTGLGVSASASSPSQSSEERRLSVVDPSTSNILDNLQRPDFDASELPRILALVDQNERARWRAQGEFMLKKERLRLEAQQRTEMLKMQDADRKARQDYLNRKLDWETLKANQAHEIEQAKLAVEARKVELELARVKNVTQSASMSHSPKSATKSDGEPIEATTPPPADA
ncbi:uncharacterized protein L969DRAFT_93874 [Mixia osmundae IAM 14324]|uniref:Uncharacterized protein n=1 Tax=Mixia osmundae (strain CBS 9802 / IAM 14324 / JCM 22182 / KY 12970) TaxID=764103 RepID=G7E9U3_MIXOS|nr:uncharacterized protein L969DRAFT_93874 [Mixia osmundae IAM 14324]KEI40045.1 hypothetical protein L969DRAFT_93874 [Mixia osmundae IAM 14324]GAA99412.1 hypothetical protein E5Q_06110 [Mixia osmundae IAM 14324]